jgi:hypothetical protein
VVPSTTATMCSRTFRTSDPVKHAGHQAGEFIAEIAVYIRVPARRSLLLGPRPPCTRQSRTLNPRWRLPIGSV